jgi:hypothetical protein
VKKDIAASVFVGIAVLVAGLVIGYLLATPRAEFRWDHAAPGCSQVKAAK